MRKDTIRWEKYEQERTASFEDFMQGKQTFEEHLERWDTVFEQYLGNE